MSIIVDESTDLKSMTDDELIQILIDCDFSTSEISRRMGKFLVYATRIYRERGIQDNEMRKNLYKSIIDQYNLNPDRCLHCGKPLTWEQHRWGNKYCCLSCRASETNLGRISPRRKSEEHKKNKQKEYSEEYTAKIHNKTMHEKYGELEIQDVKPGCCLVCGEYHCKNEFCKKHGFQQLLSMVKHLGFDPKVIGTKEVFSEFERVRNMVYDLYWNQGYSGVDLEKMFGYGKYTMYSVFLYLDIPRRQQSDAIRNALVNGKSLSKEDGSTNGFVGSSNWHLTWFGETVFLRSSYEVDYAEELDDKKISYKVEKIRLEYFDTLLNKKRVAVPDFFLPDTNELVEIKSDFTLDIQEMLDKFKVYKESGYIPRLILEHEEIDLYDIDNIISEERLNRIKTSNLKRLSLNSSVE